jgi:hypothetical protein
MRSPCVQRIDVATACNGLTSPPHALQRRPGIAHCQTKMLVGGSCASNYLEVDNTTVNEALTNLREGFLFVGESEGVELVVVLVLVLVLVLLVLLVVCWCCWWCAGAGGGGGDGSAGGGGGVVVVAAAVAAPATVVARA